ncbi:hypothetical protein [Algoriphagus boritolerans]|uniref:hypothetical protein n=1 Tax=Algoriphagus boritolerans TaxID=308111 RepID=UPI000AD27B67
MQRNLSIILLFVAHQAFPQFNSIEFRKELTSVNVIKLAELKQEAERTEIHSLSQGELPMEKGEELVLASLPLEYFFPDFKVWLPLRSIFRGNEISSGNRFENQAFKGAFHA